MDSLYVSTKIGQFVIPNKPFSSFPFQNIGTAILLGTLDSIKGLTVVFYLDREANRKTTSQQAKPGRATKESLSTPTPAAVAHHQQSSASTTKLMGVVNNKDNVKRKECVSPLFMNEWDFAFCVAFKSRLLGGEVLFLSEVLWRSFVGFKPFGILAFGCGNIEICYRY